jgi:glutathione S-transferase
MQLYYSPTSPFARKVRAVIIEKSLEASTELISVSPQENPEALLKANPLAKIPTLVTDAGMAVYDSAVITGYLETLSGRALMPDDMSVRTEVVTREAMADGIMEAAFNSAMEKRRPDAEQSRYWLSRWHDAVKRSVDTLKLPARVEPDIGDIALACALGYLDFRHSETMKWRDWRPELTDWYAVISQRKSLQETAPPEA